MTIDFNFDPDFDISNLSWVAIDLETTGINPWEYEILEIGAVKFNLHRIIGKYQVLIQPVKKQDPKSRAIHNISNEEIMKFGQPKNLAITRLLDFIGKSPLVFHNASFDLSFIKIAADDLNLKLPYNYYYDTLYLLRTYKPDLESYSLKFLQEYLDLNIQLHRALNDAEVTSYIFQWLLNENLSQLNTKKNCKTFFRYHRKMSDFVVSLPKNLDNICNYFNKYIHSKGIVKIYESNSNTPTSKSIKLIVPQEIMIFNQNIMLRCRFYPNDQSTLIPLSSYTILDPDRGGLTLANI
jgi:DNA polymerase III epsilon subunit family exonuclease